MTPPQRASGIHRIVTIYVRREERMRRLMEMIRHGRMDLTPCTRIDFAESIGDGYRLFGGGSMVSSRSQSLHNRSVDFHESDRRRRGLEVCSMDDAASFFGIEHHRSSIRVQSWIVATIPRARKLASSVSADSATGCEGFACARSPRCRLHHFSQQEGRCAPPWG